MKDLPSFILVAILLWGCQKEVTVQELQRFAATETYPEDDFFDSQTSKRALIIVAHDDDDCAMSGTIARLTSKGWQIKQLSLTRHLIPGKSHNPSHIICEGNELLLKDGNYRPGLDTIQNPYLPIPYEEIDKQFLTKIVADEIIRRVNDFKPTLIFTLDDIKGGYGHPEHIFISKLVRDLFETGKIETKRIYQSVFTDHMETEIVDKWLGPRLKKWGFPNASDLANKLYGVTGMPEPTVQYDISEVAETKMKYLRAYDEDVRKNLRKFIPYYEDFNAKTYFSIFRKEHFRVIEKPQTLTLNEGLEIPFDSGQTTLHIYVALCDNLYQGIVPVLERIGNGQDPDNNLYWGCGYGIRTFFKKSNEWTLVESQRSDSILLERLIFKHRSKDYFLIADAYDGKYIKNCTRDFLLSSCGKLKDTVIYRNTTLGIAGNSQLIAYIGHNGLMDFDLTEEFLSTDNKKRDVMILACASRSYFSPHLQDANVNPLVWTTNLMAPEAYTIHDAITGYIGGESNENIRTRAALAYSKYQKCSEKAARGLLVTGWN